MITQIEPYNEQYTKSLLKQLFLKNEISFNEIYNLLGKDRKNQVNQYISIDIKNDMIPFTPAMLKPQETDYAGAIKPYEDLVKNAYQTGTYFHIRFSKERSTERMIINIKTQKDAVNIMRYLSIKETEKLYTTSSSTINSMKFYAMIPKSRSRAFKCDKIVIYYEKTNRNIVYQEVIDAAKAFRIPPTNFLTPISGFYHVAGTEDNSFLVGIGVEISGTSFTKERSKRIFQKLTGMTYNKNTADDKYRYIGTKPDEKVFIENLYSEVISDCPKF